MPTEDMWQVHEQSKPSAVAKRAGLQPGTWASWKKKHGGSRPWLFDWLYGYPDPMPPDRAQNFSPTPLMHAFRKQATKTAIAAAAARSMTQLQSTPKRSRYYGQHVSVGLINSWLARYEGHDWFERWLLDGEEPPACVAVATTNQVRRCRKAWDYVGHCLRLGFTSEATYLVWLRRGVIPDLAWLRWLYGMPAPAGVFVVGLSLQKLREEKKPCAICRAAGINRDSAYWWVKRPDYKLALEEALRLAAGPGRPSFRPSVPLDPRTQGNMWAYAQAATLAACCRRAGVTGIDQIFRKARQFGVLEELQAYLAPTGRLRSTPSPMGMVAKNLFVPTPNMLAFRETARKAIASQELHVFSGLPGFEQWFLDWTMPNAVRGNRNFLHQFHAMTGAAGAASMNGARLDGQDEPVSTAPVVDQRNDGPRVVLGTYGEAPVVMGKIKPVLNFVPHKIVKALLGAGEEGLNKDELETVSTDARQALSRLAKDQDWAQVIHLAGRPGGRYRIG